MLGCCLIEFITRSYISRTGNGLAQPSPTAGVPLDLLFTPGSLRHGLSGHSGVMRPHTVAQAVGWEPLRTDMTEKRRSNFTGSLRKTPEKKAGQLCLDVQGTAVPVVELRPNATCGLSQPGEQFMAVPHLPSHPSNKLSLLSRQESALLPEEAWLTHYLLTNQCWRICWGLFLSFHRNFRKEKSHQKRSVQPQPCQCPELIRMEETERKIRTKERTLRIWGGGELKVILFLESIMIKINIQRQTTQLLKLKIL